MTYRNLLSLALLVIAQGAYAQESDEHTVSVQLLELADIEIEGGDVAIVLDQFDPATKWVKPESDASTSVEYRHTSASNKKITVATDNASPSFLLSVEALEASSGTATGQVALSTSAADFITNIPAGMGEATLEYFAEAPIGASAGTDSHVVTYTILAM